MRLKAAMADTPASTHRPGFMASVTTKAAIFPKMATILTASSVADGSRIAISLL